MTSSSNFLDMVLFLLSSLVTGPSFMSISSLVLELWQFTFIRDWPENQKSVIPPWVLPNIWRLGRVRDTKFGTDVPIEMLLNAAKCQGYIFYCFWVIKGKPTGKRIKDGGGGKIITAPPLPDFFFFFNNQLLADLLQSKMKNKGWS